MPPHVCITLYHNMNHRKSYILLHTYFTQNHIYTPHTTNSPYQHDSILSHKAQNTHNPPTIYEAHKSHPGYHIYLSLYQTHTISYRLCSTDITHIIYHIHITCIHILYMPHKRTLIHTRHMYHVYIYTYARTQAHTHQHPYPAPP